METRVHLLSVPTMKGLGAQNGIVAKHDVAIAMIAGVVVEVAHRNPEINRMTRKISGISTKGRIMNKMKLLKERNRREHREEGMVNAKRMGKGSSSRKSLREEVIVREEAAKSARKLMTAHELKSLKLNLSISSTKIQETI